jgi:hypothetical protein
MKCSTTNRPIPTPAARRSTSPGNTSFCTREDAARTVSTGQGRQLIMTDKTSRNHFGFTETVLRGKLGSYAPCRARASML